MKKILISMMVAVASVSAFAVSNWVTVDIQASKGDKNPGDESVKYYTAYYCTAAAAQEMFGVSGYQEVANYLKDNYDKGWKALQDEAAKEEGSRAWLLDQKVYGLEQYSFTKFFQTMPESGDFLALVDYKTDTADGTPEVDVLSGTYSGSGAMNFDDLGGSPSSGWTGTVPEPTSGMLFLLGSALLALRRKNRE